MEGAHPAAAPHRLPPVAPHPHQGGGGRPRARAHRPGADASGDAIPRAGGDGAGAGDGAGPPGGDLHPARGADRLQAGRGGLAAGPPAPGAPQQPLRRGAGRPRRGGPGGAPRSRARGGRPVRGALRWLASLAALAVLALGVRFGLRLFRPAGVDPRSVPTFVVQAVPFTRTVVAHGGLKPVRTTVVSAPTEGREPLLIAWMLDDGDPVKKDDVVVRFDAGEVTRRLADGRSDQEAAQGKIDKEKTLAASTLHERDRTATVTEEELESSRQLGKKDPRFFPRTEVIESEIDDKLYQERLDHARTARTVEERLARSKIDLAAIERRKADLFHDQAQATLGKLELRAPHDGTFVLQRWGFRGMLRAGDRAFPGMRIAEISTSEKMDAEVYVLEADAGGLAPGRTAIVVLEARPDVPWRAQVKRVDPFPKPRQPEVPAQ